jgi:hypothetical protein
MEIVLLYGGLTSNRRFVFEPRWVTLFSQSLFFTTFLFREGWGGGGEIFVWFLQGTSHIYARVLVSSWWAMCRCKLHHSISSWKMVVQTDHTYYCFVPSSNFTPSWTYYRYKIIYIPPQQSMELPDFLWLFLYIIVCICSGGHNCNNLYMCVCADIACLPILHISSYFWTIYRTFLAPLLAIRKYCMSSHTSHKFLFLDYLPHLSGSTPSN